ncbi:hypothetical protein ACQYZY_28495 [Pseudomonas aeruginosa]|uniref:hypothetical protein n=1 Tax=Pseudomonas aeruginosa TaxID=287 RepID=UPI0022DCFFAA|nr:hypothetical protein [Pseudomonas aeruginosa]WBM10895.1 hypothetical protein M1V28_31310 [Pseudomonas aeruginosa]
MPQNVFELDKQPLTTEQLEHVEIASQRDVGEWLSYPAIPIVPWVTFCYLPIDDVMNKALVSLLISFAVLIPVVCRSIERASRRDDLVEATDEDLVLLADCISEAKEHRSPAVDGYLTAVRDMGRELRLGELLMLRDATTDYVEKTKHEAALSGARAVLYGIKEES